jgi:hypothetical protein
MSNKSVEPINYLRVIHRLISNVRRINLKELLYISQALIILFTTEKYLRENEKWNKIYEYLEQGTMSFLNWRANANIMHEMKIIPDLFGKLGAVSFLLILLFISIGFNDIVMFFVYFIGISILVIFSFNWVFKHSDTIKEFKPIAYLYGFIGLIILINIFYNNLYPAEIITLATSANVTLPNQYEVAIYFIFIFSLVLLSYYVFTWFIALAIPISILFVLFITSKTSILIKNKYNKKSIIGFIGIWQLLVVYGFYSIS